MLFNSVSFFVFLMVIFVVFWLSNKASSRRGNIVLLVGSYIFYGWWDWRFLILIVISSATDFFIGLKLHQTDNQRLRKLLLATSLVVNLGMLFFFKYFNFFIDSFFTLFTPFAEPGKWNSLHIILPVGISFYTFQTLSYTMDIYRRKTAPTASVLTFFTFVAFFPQLVAGPIERARNLIPQFESKRHFSSSLATSGMKLMLWGLFKKMVIADQLAVMVNAVYANPADFGSTEIILATFLFGFQIYGDFSGYSDIAIGTARLFGIQLMTNFQTPYFSTSFREFWHRWHISLSTWFRDYLYIPLGGSRRGTAIWARNILITFTVSGLWHGANITFLIWGFLHGLLFLVGQFLSPVFKLHQKTKNVAGFVVTFVAVNLLWLFFRAENSEHLRTLVSQLISTPRSHLNSFAELIGHFPHLTPSGRVLLFVLPVFLLVEILLGKKEFSHLLTKAPKFVRWGFYYALIIAILLFGVLHTAPQFIYFQF